MKEAQAEVTIIKTQGSKILSGIRCNILQMYKRTWWTIKQLGANLVQR